MLTCLQANLCREFAEEATFMEQITLEKGKIIAIVPENSAENVLSVMRKHIYGKNAAIIGEITSNSPEKVG